MDINTPLTTSAVAQSPYITTMELIVKKHVLNLMNLTSDKLNYNSPVIENYLKEVLDFIGGYNQSLGFILNMNPVSANKLWKTIREDSNNVSLFLLQISAEYKLYHGTETFNKICEEVASSLNFVEELSVLNTIDAELGSSFRSPQFKNYLMANPWLVSLYFITLMDPLVIT